MENFTLTTSSNLNECIHHLTDPITHFSGGQWITVTNFSRAFFKRENLERIIKQPFLPCWLYFNHRPIDSRWKLTYLKPPSIIWNAPSYVRYRPGSEWKWSPLASPDPPLGLCSVFAVREINGGRLGTPVITTQWPTLEKYGLASRAALYE